ncbi:hypothetical protein [Arthrobacter sp. MMS18-M83]|uniref:hypothetical protein n=1 Tax=Arthrobacter sp. MMS18-M83 TaxID=2996261 RepID=UPI00227D26E3|nr:hypothetical protein [Arthrobacter sp. MMS18-M83]WAH97342.1 hypothetical protein OW521_00045 [Arthrobacter sp. MMS18-M83]
MNLDSIEASLLRIAGCNAEVLDDAGNLLGRKCAGWFKVLQALAVKILALTAVAEGAIGKALSLCKDV